MLGASVAALVKAGGARHHESQELDPDVTMADLRSTDADLRPITG